MAVVVEVNNTFKQREIYVLSPKKDEHYIANGQTLASNKKFYVSPFIKMKTFYNFRLLKPGKKLNVIIEQSDSKGPLLTAIQTGKQLNFTSKNLIIQFYIIIIITHFISF